MRKKKKLIERDPHSRNFPSSNERHKCGGQKLQRHVLMVGATSCLDRLMHTIPVVDALLTVSPCVDIFHVDPSHSRDSVERRVRINVW